MRDTAHSSYLYMQVEKYLGSMYVGGLPRDSVRTIWYMMLMVGLIGGKAPELLGTYKVSRYVLVILSPIDRIRTYLGMAGGRGQVPTWIGT